MFALVLQQPMAPVRVSYPDGMWLSHPNDQSRLHFRPLAAAALARLSMACRTASDFTLCWLRNLAASARFAVKLWWSSCQRDTEL